MSDSFADLWSSSAPLPPKPKAQTLAAAPSPANRPQKATTASSSRADLFSLLASSSSTSAGSSAGMTIAARMALDARTKGVVGGIAGGGPPPHRMTNTTNDSTWARLDSLAAPAPSTGSASNGVQQPGTLWDLDEFASTSSLTTPPQGKPPSQRKSIKSEGMDHFDSPDTDFDFGNREYEPSQQREILIDFDGDDFALGRGPNEGLLDGLGDDDDDDGRSPKDDDDILGMLSKPVEVVKAQVLKTSSPSTISREASPNGVASPDNNNRKTKPAPKPSSPPPHLIGQIVEMGFGVEQAKVALANTKDGVDVQAALDLLLSGSGSGSGIQSDGGPSTSISRITTEPQDERMGTAAARSRGSTPKGFKERERERKERIRRERDSGASTPVVVSDMQDHADRLLSQASEIGVSVLNKASAFWKERVVKAYEERAATPSVGDGKPKWMVDGRPGFKDDEDDDGGQRLDWVVQRELDEPNQKYVEEQRPLDVNLLGDGPFRSSPRPRPSFGTGQRLATAAASSRTSTPPSRPAAGALAPPTTSKRERPLPTASTSILATVNKHKTAGTSKFKLGQYAAAVESYSAAITVLPPGHLLSVPLLNNRALGRMRTGDYKGAAEDAGRALAVILIVESDGDGRGTVGEGDGFAANHESCSTIKVTPSSWNPVDEPPFILVAARKKENEAGWKHPQGLGVDLVEGYVKALRRRAEANEGRERWGDALRDWEVLSAPTPQDDVTRGGGGWVKDPVRQEAQRGGARCRKILMTVNQGSEPLATTASKPKPKPPAVMRRKTATSSAATQLSPSAALRSLQATTAQAEADENLKFQLKDVVDARLLAWRARKETNIRALLASLDMVLWEDILKGVKVGGLHELVTPGQVKKGYMKAIGKVHPDKLNAQNSTVEQRMLANGVFGTLNEAWIAFQNSNGM